MAYPHQLQLHNDLTRQKVPFIPRDPHQIGIYVCGMTVYDYCHIGHARVLVVFDMIVRYLRHIYGAEQVTYVRNITDIDDKIIERANLNGELFDQLTGRFITAMHEDAARLAVLPPDQEPRATHHMDAIIAMITTLLTRGFAYQGSSGDIYYDVSAFPHYGQLSGKRLDELRAGERVAVAAAKRDPLDFVLWKMAKPGEPSWPSPWGEGRPGWHIECSAMSTCALGNHFDIHGGGLDLTFPHHENEIAQSEGATGEPFVNYWLHNGFVRIDDEKMSKSLGNFFTIREVLARYHPEVLRYFILASHYRSPLNYADTQLDSAHSALVTLYTALRDAPPADQPVSAEVNAEIMRYRHRFYAAMDDDFATPEAFAVLFELARQSNRLRAVVPAAAAAYADLLRQLGELLGLLQLPPEQFLQQRGGDAAASDPDQLTDAAIEALIAERLAARLARDWGRADAIRDTLKAQGVVLEDGGDTTRWRREG